jgi:7-carboxy-7-deazaguanine synthase
MSKTLIAANPGFQKSVTGDGDIFIAEMFGDTVQGENFMGWPALFLRVQECSLNCTWCDSKEVWRFGNPYGIEEILRLWEDNGFVQKFKDGQRLVLTGGSPLRQQMNLTKLIQEFVLRHGFKPYIEVENESVLMPTEEFSKLIDCWNNSPKLESSGNSVRASYKPNVIRTLSSFQNSWFKFVVTDEEDWKEIESMYINPGFILKNQVVLMPEGQTREELSKTRDLTVNIAIEHGVRYSDRLHIVLWDKKVGV